MNDGIAFVDKQAIGIEHIQSTFKSAANMNVVSDIDT